MAENASPAAIPVSRNPVFRPGLGKMRLAAGLIFVAGLMSASGALFIVELYRRLIPAGSLSALAMAFLGVAGLMLAQGYLRYLAGAIADKAGSAIYFAQRANEGEDKAEAFLPVLRALRGRAFLAAADLSWVPVFLMVAGYLHPAFAILALALAVFFLILGRSEPERPLARPDEMARERERRRKSLVSTLRDLSQLSLLALGGALAMRGAVNVGELVGATMLSMRALAAVQMAAEERSGIIEAWKARKAI